MKKRFYSYYYLFFILISGLLFMTSCYQGTIEVSVIPGNTPAGDPIFITGNFNNWDPGDDRYRLQLQGDSTYTIQLPRGFGRIDYKYTRGDWSTVEKDICGYEISNRFFFYGDVDVVMDTIMSWRDMPPLNCPQITIVITELPENTPEKPRITLAGSFNNWNADEEAYELKYDPRRRVYYITLSKEIGDKTFRYKVTRGSLFTEETDELGFDIPPRILTFGEADSVFIKVRNWEDLGPSDTDYITYIIDEIPDNTPEDDDIYYVGDINSWYPRDRSLILKNIGDGKYSIRFPREKQGRQFKFTRGDWSTVEVDHFGDDIDNRSSYFGEKDTVYLQIMNWKDLY